MPDKQNPYTTKEEMLEAQAKGVVFEYNRYRSRNNYGWHTESNWAFDDELSNYRVKTSQNITFTPRTRPHLHAELIKQWADGAEIQVQGSSGEWINRPSPVWHTNRNYRVKPKSDYYLYNALTS